MDGEPRSADTAGMFEEKSTHRPGTTEAVHLPAHSKGDLRWRPVMPARLAAGEKGEPPTSGQWELLTTTNATKRGTHKTCKHLGTLPCLSIGSYLSRTGALCQLGHENVRVLDLDGCRYASRHPVLDALGPAFFIDGYQLRYLGRSPKAADQFSVMRRCSHVRY